MLELFFMFVLGLILFGVHVDGKITDIQLIASVIFLVGYSIVNVLTDIRSSLNTISTK